MSYLIGVRGCQHLGYGATGFTLDKQRRWNQRITDGHIAHQLTMQSMIEHGVAGVVDGGDITHYNRPLPRDVEAANRVDDLRHEAGLWGLGNSGNHDAGGGSDISSAGVMHRPSMGMLAVYPDPSRGQTDGVGPYPGLYEIHTAATIPGLPEGVALHMVSHYGLAKHLGTIGINIEPQPVAGFVNLLFAHGTFEADHRLYACIQPHGEERPIPHEWVECGWDAVLLSHYHSMGPIPGYQDKAHGQVWYTGSSLRRGFSDDPGERGWLKVTIGDVGDVTIEAVPIWQRPQHDLPVIDAHNLTVDELDAAITTNLTATPMTCDDTQRLTGQAGAILRQRIHGATPAQRRGLNALRGRYATLTADAAHWAGIIHTTPKTPTTTTTTALTETTSGATRGYTDRITDFTTDLRTRIDRLAHQTGVPTPLMAPVKQTALEWVEHITPEQDN